MLEYIDKNSVVSSFQPSEDVRLFTAGVKKDYAQGEDILNKKWVELNDRSVIEDENRGQMMFNAFVDTSVEDPRENWKIRMTRSKARNKGIAMHANLTANFLLPLFSAQNENDETDRDFSEVMRDIVEWMVQPNVSNYQSSFMQLVFGMETNPVTFLGAEWCEVYQTIKEKTASGYEKKEILDEVLSGFQAPIWSSSQVLITNAYERNIQKQRCIIRRRWTEKSELEAKYGEHENWGYVQEGWKSIYNDEDGLFYDVKDDDHKHLVAEEIYYDRRNDMEVPYIGGVYMGDSDLENNPIRHRNQYNAPKYNLIPFGFSRIGEHFFYYKSMMNAMQWDNMLYDAMTEIVMNRAILEVEVPVAVSGSDKIDSDVVFPSSVVTLKDPNAKIQQLLPNSNFAAAFRALQETDDSLSEGSVNETTQGQLPQASQKAYSVAQAQEGARKLIGATGKSLAESVIQYGDLMKDIVINHVTVPEVEELVGGGMKLKYRSFILENRSSGGKIVNKNIKFDESLIGKSMSKNERDARNLELLEKSGYPDNKNNLYLVNPEMFRKFKYLCKVDVAEMFAKGQEYWQAVLTNLFQLLANDPYVDAEGLRRKLLYAYLQSDGDDLIKKQPMMNPFQAPQGQPKSMMGGQIQNKMLSAATEGIV